MAEHLSGYSRTEDLIMFYLSIYTQRKAEFDDHMLKEHVIAIEQIDGNMSTTCNEPSDIETSESISSFTDAFQVGDITLSSSMNESLSPSINTSTTNKPRRTSNKQKKNQINLEDDDNISMASSPGENAKERQRTLDRIAATLETLVQSLSNQPQDSKWTDYEATLLAKNPI